MLAVESPQPALERKSLFRRWTQRGDRRTASPPQSMAQQPRTPNKLQRRPSVAVTSLPTPPDSPNMVASFQPPMPQKPKMITHVQRIDLSPRSLTPPSEHTIHISPRCGSQQRVLAGAMPTTPFPGTPLIRPWNVFLPPAQVFSLYLGFLPRETSDKWYIYSEDPDQTGKLKVHFHRSWTGIKIAEMFVVMDVKGEGAGKIVGLKWNGTFDTNRMNEDEAKYMLRTTCKWTLGVELESRD